MHILCFFNYRFYVVSVDSCKCYTFGLQATCMLCTYLYVLSMLLWAEGIWISFMLGFLIFKAVFFEPVTYLSDSSHATFKVKSTTSSPIKPIIVTYLCRLQVASKFMPVSSLIIGECNFISKDFVGNSMKNCKLALNSVVLYNF